MAEEQLSWFDKVTFNGTLKRWKDAAASVTARDLPKLKAEQTAARALERNLQEFLSAADAKLTKPYEGADAMSRPPGTDWSWRPDVWRQRHHPAGIVPLVPRTEYGKDIMVFHDCELNQAGMRQVRNRDENDLAPYGTKLDVYQFEGSFLSLVITLPDEMARSTTRQHLIQLDSLVNMERRVDLFARLNVQYGPNSEQVLREIDTSSSRASVVFDLAYTKVNEKRIEKMWVDLIIEAPRMNQITFRDISFCRYPRAKL